VQDCVSEAAPRELRNFWRDYERYRANGVTFVREPKREPYGTVAVFKDIYGNLWDLIEPNGG